MNKNAIDTTLPKNLPLLLKQSAERYPEMVCQAAKGSDGKFVNYSYKDFYNTVLGLALAFKQLNVKKGENVALISDNRREWLLADMGLLSIGAVDVPRGCDSMAREITYIISFSGCRIAIFENEKQLYKVTESDAEMPDLKTAILFDCDNMAEAEEKAKAKNLEVILFSDLLAKAETLVTPESKKEIEDGMEAIDPNDNATMIYTSGTTGTPKGVMLTHRNYIAQCEVVKYILPVQPGEMWLSVLPVWHSFERAIQYFSFTFGSGLAYSKPVAPIMLPDFAAIKPQWMCGVPRLWDSLAKGVIKAMKKAGGVKYAMFRFFVSVGAKYAWAKDHVTGRVTRFKKYPRFLDFIKGIIPFILLWPLHGLGELLVYKKVREKMGGQIKAAISGGGALQKETDNFYRAIGLKLLEGYGITECAPVLSVRNPRYPRPGCVGEIFPCADVKIVAEKNGIPTSLDPLPPGKTGLVFAKGDQIMKGYYKQPELTESVMYEGGWFNTGDLGMLTVDGEIKITGRAKDTIVLVGGENIEPLAIEIALNSTTYIDTAVILGQDQKYLGALIVPAKETIMAYAKENNIPHASYNELIDTPEITSIIMNDISKRISAANGFRTCEKIFKIKCIPEPFTVGKELSAKQELMRYKVNELYKDEIATLWM